MGFGLMIMLVFLRSLLSALFLPASFLHTIFHSTKPTPFYTFTAVSVTEDDLESEEEDTRGRPAASCVASHSGTSALGIFRSR